VDFISSKWTVPALFSRFHRSIRAANHSSTNQIWGIGENLRHCQPIKLNEDWEEDRQKIPTQIRLRIELLVLALEDLETERERLQGNFISLKHLEKIFDAMNKARYYLHVLES
jgi:hypothetical protein